MPFTINNSRDFTYYISSNEVDTIIQKRHGITDARAYKDFIQKNADAVIQEETEKVIEKVGKN